MVKGGSTNLMQNLEQVAVLRCVPEPKVCARCSNCAWRSLRLSGKSKPVSYHLLTSSSLIALHGCAQRMSFCRRNASSSRVTTAAVAISSMICLLVALDNEAFEVRQ